MERLDGLIGRIREMQGPWMHGGRGADVLLVCVLLLISRSINELSRWGMGAICSLMEPGVDMYVGYRLAMGIFSGLLRNAGLDIRWRCR